MNFCAKKSTNSALIFWRENSNIWKVTQFLNKIFEFSPQNITKNLRTQGLSFRTEKSKIWKLIVWSWSKSIIKEIHLWKTTCPCQSNKMTLFAFCISILKLMTLGHLQKFGCNSWTKKLTLYYAVHSVKKNRQNLAKCTRLKISSVTQCLQITKNVSLKMFEISRIGKFFVGKFKNVLKVRQFWDLQTLCFFL